MTLLTKKEAMQMISKSSKFDHSIMVSKIMVILAKNLQLHTDEWELTGLLHDLDYDLTKDTGSQHGIRTAEILGNKVSSAISYAIKAHDPGNRYEANTTLDKGLILADCLAWLIDDQRLLELDINLMSAMEKEAAIKPKIVQNIRSYSKIFTISLEKIIEELKLK